MAELTRLKRIRAGHKSTATKWIGEVDGLATAAEGRTQPDKVRLAQLKKGLQEQHETLDKLNKDILALVEEEAAIGDEITSSQEFKLTIYGAILKIDKLLKEGGATDGLNPPPTPSAAPTSHNSRPKLPKLELQHFSGDPTKWYSFWELYDAAIHSNGELSDVEKFTYLRTLLEKSAHEAIAGLALTGENYKEAVEILEARYGNKQLIINKHMDILLDVQAVQSIHDVVALRKFYDKVESQMRSLKALGRTTESYGSLLIPVLMKRLPQEFRLVLSRKMKDEEWSVTRIMKELEDEVKAREKTAQTPKSIGDRRPSRPTGATLYTCGKNVSCCYCGRHGHFPEACRSVNNVDARKGVLRREGRCFTCLSKGHVSADCRGGQKCSKCKGRHHISICYKVASISHGGTDGIERSSSGQGYSSAEPTKSDHESRSQVSGSGLNPTAPSFGPTTTMCTRSNQTVLLQMAKAVEVNPDDTTRSMEIYIILDNGSQKSYITRRIKKLLRLRTLSKRPLSIMTFGASEEKRQVCETVKVRLCNREGEDQEVRLLAVPLICEPVQLPSTQFCIEKYDHLRRLELVELGDIEPDILIGSDHYWEFLTGEVIRGSEGPVAAHCTLGWILSGPVKRENASMSASLVIHVLGVNVTTAEESKQLDAQLKAFWDLESFGIEAKETSVSAQFQSTVRFVDGRYEVNLPWKNPDVILSDNYNLCLRRLRSLLRRLRKEPHMLKRYEAVIMEQLENGIIEEVDPGIADGQHVHYLPHHAVVRYDKDTTKLRVVYDASARSDGMSLNDCLHVGPKFNQKIFDILVRFRAYGVALMGDIEKAFLMVSVAQGDRDALRFLWVEDVDNANSKIRVMRFARVVFGVTASPFLLNATIHFHLESKRENHEPLVSKLQKSFYVDDLVCGSATEEEAYALYLSSKRLLHEGGFNLRKFTTNNRLLRDKIERMESLQRSGNSTGSQNRNGSTLSCADNVLSEASQSLSIEPKKTKTKHCKIKP